VKIIHFLLAFQFSSLAMQAANREINLVGTIADTFTKKGINGVNITFMTPDSTEIDVRTSMLLGDAAYYAMKVPAQKAQFLVKFEHPDYETGYISYNLKTPGRNTQIDLPPAYIKRKNTVQHVELDEVVVQATKIKLIHKGDTLVFNADAFNVAEGSMLDDLVRQMPGVELKRNGEIFVNGEKIDYMMLNGKDFFRGNNKLMLENLPYYVVQNIKVYKRTTDRMQTLGVTDGKRDYVMDVYMKREYRQGYIANAEVGGGTHDSFLGRLFGLRFTDHSRLTLIGNGNNLDSEYKPDDSGEDFMNQSNRDGRINRKTVSGGFLLDTPKWKNNLEVTLGGNSTHREERQQMETIVEEDAVKESLDRITHESSFLTSATNTFTLKSPFFLESTTHMDFEHTDNTTDRFYNSSQVTQTGQLLQHTRYLSLQQQLNFSRKLAWGDVIDLGAIVGYSERNHADQEKLETQNNDTLTLKNTDIRRPEKRYNYRTSVGYSIHDFHLGVYKVELMYGQEQLSDTEERMELSTLLPDKDNSYHLNQLQRTLQGALHYTRDDWEKEKYIDIYLPVRREYRRAYYRKSMFDSRLTQQYWFFDPTASYETSWKRHTFTGEVSYAQLMPEITLLADVPNTVNPLYTYLGNERLGSEGKASVKLHYFDESHSGQVFRIRLDGSRYFNRIVQSYLYNPNNGNFTYTPINVDGDGCANLYVEYSIRLGEESPFYFGTKTSGDIDIRHDYSGIVGAGEQMRRRMTGLSGSETLNLLFEKGNTRIDFRAAMDWYHSTSNSSTFEDVNARHYRYGVEATTVLPWDISFTSSLFMEHRRGYTTSSLNTNECRWDMTVGRSFLRSKKILVRVTAMDILHNYSAVSYTISPSGRSEVWQYSLPAYWLLRVAYKFQLNPKK
jgi:hypothetical protein